MLKLLIHWPKVAQGPISPIRPQQGDGISPGGTGKNRFFPRLFGCTVIDRR